MLESFIETYLPFPIHLLELMGIIIIVIGGLKAFYHYAKSLFMEDPYSVKYQFANSMAMALEFKLGAEILKTVLVRSLSEIAILGSIVLLRVVITFIITWEMKQERAMEENQQK